MEERMRQEVRQMVRSQRRSKVRVHTPAVEPRPGPQPEALRLIFVVADEHERRARDDLPVVGLQPDGQVVVLPQHFECGEHQRGPFRTAALSQTLAGFDDAWVDANR